MALNQVIHGSNRVVENPNRYKLNAVSGQANTYDLEKMPGVITDNGTPYNKNILDTIDNVLSYLTPSVEKVEQQIEKTENINYSSNLIAESVDTTISQNNWFDKIDITYPNIATNTIIKPTLKIHTNNSNGINVSSGNTLPQIYFYYNGNNYYTKTQLFNTLTQTSSQYEIRMKTNTTDEIYFDYDFGCAVKTTLNLNSNNNISQGTTLQLLISNDGTNWSLILSDIIGTISHNITIPSRYVRLKYTQTSSNNRPIGYMYFTNTTGVATYYDIAYQNQFTLDNNGQTFVNNQRLLVETPSEIYRPVLVDKLLVANSITESWVGGDTIGTEINVNYGIIDGIYPTSKYMIDSSTPTNFVSTTGSDTTYTSVYSKVNNSNKLTSVEFLNNENITKDTYASLTYQAFNEQSKDKSVIKVYDLKKSYKIKINYYIKSNEYYNAIIYGSNDNVIWNELNQFVFGIDGTYESTNEYRYYKIVFDKIKNISSAIQINYIDLYVKYIEILPIPFLDGVTSNTLNGIDIPTLLQPSTKYELIYKEDTNKFELGGNLPLYDITLTESVNQVDLTGIYDKLKSGKLYNMMVFGTMSTAGTFDFGNTSSGYLSINGALPSNTFFIAPKESNTSGNKNILLWCTTQTSGNVSYKSSNLDNAEYLKCFSTYKFNVGTRIIIKEVA